MEMYEINKVILYWSLFVWVMILHPPTPESETYLHPLPLGGFI